MTLKLKAIKNAGELTYERLVISVTATGDAGECVVIQSKNNEGFPSAGQAQCYWLPDMEVNEGDLLVIYSKSGNDRSKKNLSGSSTHFYYWGSRLPLWNGDQVAVLLTTNHFETLNTHYPDSDDTEPTSET